MINNVSKKQFEDALHLENPSWTLDAVKKQAAEYLSLWDERLSDLLNTYLTSGIEQDFQHGEFSVLLIKALRHNCGFLYALSLMDAYMKDPLNGKALILRR